MKYLLIYIIEIYQKYISPLTPASCKYIPTCSEYAKQAIRTFGTFRGTMLSLFRILRCNPFSKGGYDPLPIDKLMKKK